METAGGHWLWLLFTPAVILWAGSEDLSRLWHLASRLVEVEGAATAGSDHW